MRDGKVRVHGSRVSVRKIRNPSISQVGVIGFSTMRFLNFIYGFRFRPGLAAVFRKAGLRPSGGLTYAMEICPSVLW